MSFYHSRPSARKYHQGWVHLKQSHTYRKMFAELRAKRELLFYFDETKAMGPASNCQQRVDLRQLRDIFMQADRRPGNPHPEFVLTLKLDGTNDVKLRFTTTEDRNVWTRYIRAVGLNQLPPASERLLPGQIHEMQDIIDYEQAEERRASQDDDPDEHYLDMTGGTNQFTWYYPHIYSRHEAENILRQGSSHGNMMIRRRQKDNDWDPNDYAVSTMQSSTPESFNHYKMSWCPKTGSFRIVLKDGPHAPLPSMEDVMEFFEKRSNRSYTRLAISVMTPSHDYAEHVFPDPPQNIYVNDAYHNNKRTSKR